jgi:hypothetical protein
MDRRFSAVYCGELQYFGEGNHFMADGINESMV